MDVDPVEECQLPVICCLCGLVIPGERTAALELKECYPDNTKTVVEFFHIECVRKENIH